MYILIVLNLVQAGAVVTTQEFADKQSCEAAIVAVQDMASKTVFSRGPIGMVCVSKAKGGKDAND